MDTYENTQLWLSFNRLAYFERRQLVFQDRMEQKFLIREIVKPSFLRPTLLGGDAPLDPY